MRATATDADGDGLPDLWEHRHHMDLRDARNGELLTLTAPTSTLQDPGPFSGVEPQLADYLGDETAYQTALSVYQQDLAAHLLLQERSAADLAGEGAAWAQRVALLDPDGDGLTNRVEYQNGTLPRVADTDGDGFSDQQEVETGSDPLRRASLPPLQLAVVGAGMRTVYAGQLLAAPLEFRVHRAGQPVPQTLVTLTPSTGTLCSLAGVTLRQRTLPTDAGGIIRVQYRGAATATAGTIAASLPAGSTSTAVVQVQTLSAGPVLAAVSGDAQVGQPGEILPLPLTVQVTHLGQPLAGVPITFQASGGSLVSAEGTEIGVSTTVTSGADGRAGLRLLMPDPGSGVSVLASAAGAAVVSFTASAAPTSQAMVLTLISGDNQAAIAGTALQQPFVFKATRNGQPVAGALITLTAEAGIWQNGTGGSTQSQRTNSEGIVTGSLTTASGEYGDKSVTAHSAAGSGSSASTSYVATVSPDGPNNPNGPNGPGDPTSPAGQRYTWEGKYAQGWFNQSPGGDQSTSRWTQRWTFAGDHASTTAPTWRGWLREDSNGPWIEAYEGGSVQIYGKATQTTSSHAVTVNTLNGADPAWGPGKGGADYHSASETNSGAPETAEGRLPAEWLSEVDPQTGVRTYQAPTENGATYDPVIDEWRKVEESVGYWGVPQTSWHGEKETLRLKRGPGSPADQEVRHTMVRKRTDSLANPKETIYTVEFVIEPNEKHSEERSFSAIASNDPSDQISDVLLPVEFISRQSGESETTIAVEGVGLTNQPPIVDLENVQANQINVNGNTATVPIKGIIRDAIMDNVAPGKGADITEATVYVNGEVDRVIQLTRSEDGPRTFWRNYPAKATIPSINITVPAVGMASIRVETSANAAGIRGSGEIVVSFTEHAQPGPRVGAYTRQYGLAFSSSLSTTSADTIIITGVDGVPQTLSETGPETLVFKSPAPPPSDPNARTFTLNLLSPYTGSANQAVTIMCELGDSQFTGGSFLGSGRKNISCTETGPNTGNFVFSETEPGIISGYTYSYTVQSVSKMPLPSEIGNHPFSFRLGGSLDNAQQFKLGAQSFQNVTIGGSTYPKLDDTRQVNAYIVRDESQTPPQKQLLYYDAAAAALKRIPVTNDDSDLMLKLVVGTQTNDLFPLRTGSLSFVGADGEEAKEINRVSILTLLDLINGDSSVVIDDDSWEKVRVKPIAKPDEIVIRVKSSEIESDYFTLKLNPSGNAKEARLLPAGDGYYESELKIVVYYPEDGHETLSEPQWTALKQKGYLAVHNLKEEAWEIIRDTARDKSPTAVIQEHHLFAQKFRSRFKTLLPDIDINDFCIPIERTRHLTFSPAWNEDMEALLNQFTTPSGRPKAGVTLKDAREAVFNKIFDVNDPQSLCNKYHVDPTNPIRWKSRPRKSTRDLLGKTLLKYAGPQLLNSSHKATRLIISLAKKAGRGGVSLARKHKGIGIVLGSWALLTNGPKAAAAEFFQITPAGVDAMLEGQTSIDFEIWDPEGSVDLAELRSGQIIREGDEYWYAWRDLANPAVVGIVDRGEVDYIMPTSTPGVVDVFVRFGQERREYKGIDFMREDINPMPGDPWPQ